MVFPILGANTESAAYEIQNSLRFNDDDSPKVSRSISSSGSARNATLSVWVKRGNLGTRQQIYSNKTADSGFSAMNMYFNASNDRLYIDHHDGSSNCHFILPKFLETLRHGIILFTPLTQPQEQATK